MSKQAALALAWTLVILTICWLPTKYVQPDVKPGGFSLGELHVDKLGHTGIFAILSYLLISVPWLRQRPGLVVFLGGVVAVVSEVGQGLLPTGRTADLFDLLADLAGVFLGVWVYRRLRGPLSERSVEQGVEVSARG
ncbi:hypothetical protein BH23PLA1_BH23PLA1_01070 [soil metagenome]